MKDLLDQLAAAAQTPFEQASALPAAFYRSLEMLSLERERLFHRGWVCLGRAADIPATGDYLTFSIGEQPVFAVRGEDGKVRCFANICRHRMMRLLEGHGQCRHIVCPYHAWTYDLEGQLRRAPFMSESPDFEPEDVRLAAVTCEIWQGWIYASLNEEAPSLSSQLAPLEAVVKRYRMSDYVPVVTQDHVWQTNWKILTENFMEGYHLPIAHAKTVGAWFPTKETRFPEERHAAFTYQLFKKTGDASYGLAHRDNATLQDEWRQTSVMPTIFPSHMYVLAPDHLWYLSLNPKSVGEVEVRFGVALAPEVYVGLDDPDAAVAELVGFFDQVNAEDRDVVEAIYANAAAPLAQPGRLSWLERELHDFHVYLAEELTSSAESKSDVTELRAELRSRR